MVILVHLRYGKGWKHAFYPTKILPYFAYYATPLTQVEGKTIMFLLQCGPVHPHLDSISFQADIISVCNMYTLHHGQGEDGHDNSNMLG